MRKIISILIFWFCGLVVPVYAQQPFFRKIDIPVRASESKILAICEDSRKVLWIGTDLGLLKFNGLTFEPVVLPDSLKGEQIITLSAYHRNGIIAGTHTGKLFTVADDVISFINLEPDKVQSAISSILVSGPDSFWFSTKGDGLFRYKNQVLTQYSTVNGLADNYVYSIVQDTNNHLWLGTDGGVVYCNYKEDTLKFRSINVFNGLPENIVRKVIKGPGNTIGIGMEEKGFCLYDYVKHEFIRIPFFEKWEEGPVASMILLENEFWIGTEKSGITDYEFRGKNRIRKFFGSDKFPGKDVNCMIKDYEGNVWIGAGSELYFSTGENIEYTRSIGDLKLGNITTILTDDEDNIWFSNEHGLYCYLRFKNEEYDLFEPLKGTPYENYNIISLFQDHYGFVWIGTFDHGVLRFDPKSKKIIALGLKDGLTNLNVLSIDGTRNELWFATLGGVSKCYLLDTGLTDVSSFKSYTEENGLGNNFIYDVFIDSHHRVWFATDGRGITCFENNKFVNYDEVMGLTSKVIYSIAEDNSGNIWFSSQSSGIYRFDGNEFRNFSYNEGLSDLNISGIANDANGNLIIINKKGVDILDPENFQILSFGKEVGLVDIDPDLNVLDVDNSGDIYAGIQDGIVRLSFEKSAGAKAPIIILDRVSSFLDKVDTASVKKFDYNRNYISFNYFAVWYSDPAKVTYQYKLEGYSNEWITTGDRIATFPNLAPGKYNFLVRASSNMSFDNAKVASYSFEIKKPFWNESWFMILISILVVIIMYAYLKFRDDKVKSLEKLNRERIESQFEVLKNQVNPHFLFNSFNTLISVIEDDKNIAVEYVIKLSDFFRSILAVREMDLISLKEELSLVNNYIFLQQKRYGTNFIVNIEIPEELIDECIIPPLSLQILLENCLKHNAVSSEATLKCELGIEGDKYLVVKNNINPKFDSEPSTGIGLQNVRNRFKILTGKNIVVEEIDGYFIVKLPLIKTSK